MITTADLKIFWKDARFKFIFFTAGKIQFEVFWVVTPCSECYGRLRTFRRTLLHPSSGFTFVVCNVCCAVPSSWRQQSSPKRW
jgi:hypothetical protein